MLHDKLHSYLTSLQEKDLNNIANAVITKFISNRSRINNKIAANLFKYYSNHKQKLLNRYFTKWSINYNPIKHKSISSISKGSSLASLATALKKKNNKPLKACSSMKNFFERQKEFSKKKIYSKERLFNSQEEQTGMHCTFNPNISRLKTPSCGNNTNREHNVYIRLYNYDSCTKHGNSKKPLEVSCDESAKKISLEKIEKLYNDYKESKNKMISLRKKFDDEDGLTFQPNVKMKDGKIEKKNIVKGKESQKIEKNSKENVNESNNK